MHQLNVVYLGRYDPNYSRNRIIINGLLKNNVRVTECQCSNMRNFICYPYLLYKYFSNFQKFDAIFIGAFRHRDIPVGRFISSLFNIPLIFDPLVSRFETQVLDRQKVDRNSYSARRKFRSDKYSLNKADKVLCDTFQHREYYQKLFDVPEERLEVVYLGADDEIFYPRKRGVKDGKFRVRFYGSYIPLQGVQYIIKAAKLLERYDDITFELVGRGETFSAVKGLSEELSLKNIYFYPWLPYDKLPDFIADADLCLGVFGDSGKAKRVIPNKVFQPMAMKIPVITGDTPAVREIFEGGKHLLLCNVADPQDLAQVILTLKKEVSLRTNIATNAYRLIKSQFTTFHIGRRVVEILHKSLNGYER